MSLVETTQSPGLRARAILAALFTLTLLGPPLLAQIDLQLTTTAEHEIGEMALDAQGEQLELTLEDAISLALERNLGLVVQRYQRSQTLMGVLSSMSIYDFGVSATLATRSSTVAVTSTLEDPGGGTSITADSNTYNFGLSQLIPYGGTASVNFGSTRSATSNRNSVFNPDYSENLTFTYAQPLLRGRGRKITERSIILAKYDNALNLEGFEIQVNTLVESVSTAYWNLVQAREQLKVALESLNLAQELHKMNKIQVDVGTMAPLETVQSEATVASREGEIIRFTAQVEDNEDSLRQLMNLSGGELWNMPIMPSTEPEAPYIEIDMEMAVRQALRERPEISQQRITIERREFDARFFRNQRLPQVDLTGSYGPSATGGINENSNQDYFDVFSDLLKRDNEAWSIRVDFRYALQNRAAKAQSAIADLALEESAVQLSNVEQDILLDVRRAGRAVLTAEKQIEAAKSSSRLARKNLEAEQKRYENGLATSFTLLDIQEALSTQLRQEVNAIIDYRTALVAFANARGVLLDEMGVELASGE